VRNLDDFDVLGDQTSEACQEILVMRLAKLPAVVSFREEALGGNLIQPDEIDDWICLNGGPGTENLIQCTWHFNIEGHDEELFWHDVELDSPSGHLAVLAKKLVDEHYLPWEEEEVVTFILTGHRPEPYMLNLEIVQSEIMPLGAQIRMTINPRVSIKAVSQTYTRQRNRLLQLEEGSRSKPRPISEKNLRLAVFTEKHRGTGTWDELRRRWNKEHRKWAYSEGDTWNFARAAKVAWERVTGDKFDGEKKQL
jgi:hypothetical protein